MALTRGQFLLQPAATTGLLHRIPLISHARPPLLATLITVTLMTMLLSGCDTNQSNQAVNANHQTSDQSQKPSTEAYAGTATCSGCHAAEAELWRESHHDLAMQPATPTTALGDFSDSVFDHNGVSSRFTAREAQLFVTTDGEDGELATFPVRYTFGVYPLQQYLVELPGGRLQALSIAWDTRPADAGGQRWFHVYGDELIDHGDVLHWTQPSQNWETMCADCHSTGLVSTYLPETDNFATDWAELNVACEACHGPGAEHVAWAEDAGDSANKGLNPALIENNGVSWILDPDSGNSRRSTPRVSNIEINACAGCHSRRARLSDDTHAATAFLDNYSPALIEPPLYHADGQIRDEVYVYGSFLQSRMHQAGVSCSDCHDPHSLQLKAPGPDVCLQCHAGEKFATVEHQLHAKQNDNDRDTANCIDCHMPATTYMQVDPRNDHSFRIPRPELSVAYGVPNACNNCHTDKDANWAVEILRSANRLAADEQPHWSALLASAGEPNQINQASMQTLNLLALDESVPELIRATALSRLRLSDSPAAIGMLGDLASSPDPLVRMGAARALQESHPLLKARLAPRLLDDPLRAVRLDAASALADVDPVMLPTGTHADVQAGFAEYLAVQNINAERPEAHVNIANLQRLQNRFDIAEREYQTAIALGPSFVPGYVNLADLYRAWGREADAEKILRAGIALQPGQSSLQHSLGLSLIRQQRVEEALPALQLAAESPDATARFALVYAVALNSLGKNAEAIRFLESALLRFGDNPELQQAVAEYNAQR